MSTPDLRYRDHLGDAHARLALSRLVSEDPDAFPLDEAVLLLALDERPDVDLTTTRERLDRLADRIHLRPGTSLQEAVARLAIGLFGEGRLQGDTETYDDPQNSDLPRVLERQRGLPILLSIVMLGVARRLDLPLAGVSFPGHFLVGPAHGALEASGMTHKRSFWLDPFHGGRVLQVLIRVNQNLKRAWAKRKDSAGALRAIDRILLLTPDAWPQHRDRGLLLARIGAHRDARAALTTYLAHAPEASDAPRISMILSSLQMQVG